MTRCLGAVAFAAILTLGPPAAAQTTAKPFDEWLTHPVDDRTFATFLTTLAFDSGVPFDTRTLGDTDLEGVHRQHLSFQSTPGQRVYAYLYRPLVLDTSNRRAVILIHGGVPRGKDAHVQEWISESVARAGWTVLSLDLEYFGERRSADVQVGTAQQRADHLYNHPAFYAAWVAQVRRDVSQALDLLVKTRGIDDRRVLLVGVSRGATVTPIVAVAEPRIAGVAMLYGGHHGALERTHLAVACPANYIGRLAPRPLLMVNGEHDAIIPRDASVLPIQRLAREPREFHWTEGGHGPVNEPVLAQLLPWLERSVRPR